MVKIRNVFPIRVVGQLSIVSKRHILQRGQQYHIAIELNCYIYFFQIISKVSILWIRQHIICCFWQASSAVCSGMQITPGAVAGSLLAEVLVDPIRLPIKYNNDITVKLQW